MDQQPGVYFFADDQTIMRKLLALQEALEEAEIRTWWGYSYERCRPQLEVFADGITVAPYLKVMTSIV
jgi:hypothetical protein